MASPSLALALLPLALLALLAAQPAAARGSFPPPPRTVQCLVAPCSTPACKAKCNAFKLSEYTRVKCVDNYVGGCNCDCCLEKEQLCRAGSILKGSNTTAPCCKGTVCDFSTSCVTDPRTKCGTICLNPADAVSRCQKLGQKCDKSKIRCCPGSSCQASGKDFRCAKCKGMGETCSATKPCCRLLSCVSKNGASTCAMAPPP